MNEHSNKFDDCTDDREIFSEDELDLSSLDTLEYELTHMNGRATLAPPVRSEAAELAELDFSMRPLDKIASEPDPGAAIRAEAYAAQDRSAAALPANVALAHEWKQKQAAHRGKAREARTAARDAAREEKSAKLKEARRLRHAERERDRRKASREARAAIPAPTISPPDAVALRAEAKRFGETLIAATTDPASPERVRRLRGEERGLILWFIARQTAALKVERARASVPSRKIGPSLEIVAGERTKQSRDATVHTRFAARHALGKIQLLIDAGLWPAL